MIRTIAAALSPLGWTMQTLSYMTSLQRTQNTLACVVAGNRTPGSNLDTLSKLHWLPIHDRIKMQNC